MQLLRSGKAAAIAPTTEAMADYDSRRIAAARTTIFASGCTNWYLDAAGVPITRPWSYQSFAEEMNNPRLEDYAL